MKRQKKSKNKFLLASFPPEKYMASKCRQKLSCPRMQPNEGAKKPLSKIRRK